MLDDAAAADPANPQAQQILATFYWEKVFKDASLTPTERMRLHASRALPRPTGRLPSNPDFVEALVYKNILLRMEANSKRDARRRAR